MKVTVIKFHSGKPQLEENLKEYIQKGYPVNSALETMIGIPVKYSTQYVKLRNTETDAFIRTHSDGTDTVFKILKLRYDYKVQIDLDKIIMTNPLVGLFQVATEASRKIWGYQSTGLIDVYGSKMKLYRLNLEAVLGHTLDDLFGYSVEECDKIGPNMLNEDYIMLHIVEILFCRGIKYNQTLLTQIYETVPNLKVFRDNLRLSKDVHIYFSMGLTGSEIDNILNETQKLTNVKPEYIYELTNWRELEHDRSKDSR